MARRRDWLTLGLTAESRWNPIYRWWVRRTTIRTMALALKALVVLYDGVDPDAPAITLVLDEDTLALAARYSAVIGTSIDGGLIRIHQVLDAPAPAHPRILYGDTARRVNEAAEMEARARDTRDG